MVVTVKMQISLGSWFKVKYIGNSWAYPHDTKTGAKFNVLCVGTDE